MRRSSDDFKNIGYFWVLLLLVKVFTVFPRIRSQWCCKVMLATLWWWATIGDSFKMLVTESLCCGLFNVKSRSQLVTHQHLKVTNINRLQPLSPTNFFYFDRWWQQKLNYLLMTPILPNIYQNYTKIRV